MSEQPTYSDEPLPPGWRSHADTHADDPSQPTVAATLRAGTHLRHLAHHLAGITGVNITVHTTTHGGQLPHLAIQCLGEHAGTDAATLVERLDLPRLTAGAPYEGRDGTWQRHLRATGTWYDQRVEVTAVVDAPDAALVLQQVLDLDTDDTAGGAA